MKSTVLTPQFFYIYIKLWDHVTVRRPQRHLYSLSLSLSSERMIDLSISDKKLFSFMGLLPLPSHFPWAIIAGLSERPMITTGLGHKGKSISAWGNEGRGRSVDVCVCVYMCVPDCVNSWQGHVTIMHVCTNLYMWSDIWQHTKTQNNQYGWLNVKYALSHFILQKFCISGNSVSIPICSCSVVEKCLPPSWWDK